LAVPGGAVAGVVAAGGLSAIGQPRLDVRLTAARRRVQVGQDPGVVLTVANVGRRRAAARVLTLPLTSPPSGALDGAVRASRVRLPGRLAPGARAAVAVAAPTDRRALLRVGPAQAVRGDPFGLVARAFSWGPAVEVAVCPRTLAAPVSVAGLARDIEGRPTGQASEPDASFHALREYQPGDDVRAVHWRSSARLGRTVVRQSEDTRRVRLALILGAAADEYGAPEDFELAVSVYASIGLGQLAEAGDLAVVVGGRAPPLVRATPGALLDQAAAIRLDPSGGTDCSLAAGAALARRQAAGATLAVLVTGARLTEPDLRRIARLLPRGAAVGALRCGVGAQLAGSRAGGLALATLGRLEDLPGALRRWGIR
jgi:uncharacterized protein (DUF58 family)